MSKYMEDEWGWMPKRILRYWVSKVWQGALKVREESNVRGEVFKRGVSFKVGVGNRVHFWVNDCVGRTFCMGCFLGCLVRT